MKKYKKFFSELVKFLILIVLLLVYIYISYNNNWTSIQRVSSTETRKVNPIGSTIGLKMYTNGVLVVGMSDVSGIDGRTYSPYKDSEIKEGDLIKSINGIDVKTANQVTEIVNNSNGNELLIKYDRDGNLYDTKIKPVETSKKVYMIGLWVRDAAAGIGTLTYYEEKKSSFAALGHGINDIDTDALLNIEKGELVTAKIVSIVKGYRGRVGEIRGIIDDGELIGQVSKNTDFGVYGKVTNLDYINSVKLPEVDVAARNQIKEGKASIYCQLSNEGVKEYEIEIKKIYSNNSKDNKSMLIKVTDDNLLNITGGIIPGMSGTPIIQNGRFVGAITNVLLNDPTQGYAIFADLMNG